MHIRRISVALVAAAATTVGLVSPVATGAELSPECKAEVAKAKADHQAAVDNGTATSSFMGPQELATGIINGYGSSGMPQTPECVNAADAKDPVELPDWAKSAETTPEMKETFAWINMLVAIAAGFVQLLSVLAAISPDFAKSLAAPLKQLGIRF